MVDGMPPGPGYLSQSRSLTRLSRIETHKVGDASFNLCLVYAFYVISGSLSHFCLFLKRWLLIHQAPLDTCL